ncbi:TrbI/VirB10 family protein [Caulobacter sp. DWR1-3-2b1]|uniref:TrbI/VirB10 family protein n=1 Tax=Caulobacter sp. DWR1-3-2b1 TaxID=2804670 RepID=UPI003CEDB70D
MNTNDHDPRQTGEVIDDLAVADAQAQPAVARAHAGVPTPVILAGFGLIGLGLFFWMSANRTDANASTRPLSARAQAISTAMPAVLPTSGPLYAVPAPQFSVDNAIPVPQMISAPRQAARSGAPAMDLAQRRRAPTLVVDFGGERPAALIKAGGDGAPMIPKGTTAASALNPDERFADRVSMSEAEPARAVAMRDLDATIPQGAVIPAVMETAINSDLPGLARAMVVRDIKSFDGSTVLIPRGSRVIGQYKSGVALGASRVFVIWTRIIRPDGVSIQIASPAADPLGRGGLEGKVDRHFFGRFGGSILMSVLNAGVAAVGNARSTSQIYIGTAAEAANLASAVVKTDQGVAPTIQTRQGAPVTIFVARDLDFSGVRGGRS